MEIKINISKKHLYLITALFIVFVGLILVIATGNTQSHSSSEVNVSVNGQQMSLQEAIDLNKLKGNILDYDSGWFDVNVNTYYTKTHNLGTKDYNVLILYRKAASSNYSIASAYEQPYRVTWDGANTGAVVLDMDTNSIKIRTGNKALNGIGFTDLASQYYSTTGQYRILLWKFS